MMLKATMMLALVGVASAAGAGNRHEGLVLGKGKDKKDKKKFKIPKRFVTFADGRPDGGIRQSADIEDGQDSPGDVFVFDQKLLDEDATTVIGRNAGYCIRTDPGMPDWSGPDHPTLPDDPNNNWGQCTWTLSFYEGSGFEGTIQVSGRESDQGTSAVSIVGGTGDFLGAYGELLTTPVPQTEGVLFEQVLEIKNKHRKNRKHD